MFSHGGLAELQSQRVIHVPALSPLIFSSSEDQELFKIPQNIEQNMEWKLKEVTSNKFLGVDLGKSSFYSSKASLPSQ